MLRAVFAAVSVAAQFEGRVYRLSSEVDAGGEERRNRNSCSSSCSTEQRPSSSAYRCTKKISRWEKEPKEKRQRRRCDILSAVARTPFAFRAKSCKRVGALSLHLFHRVVHPLSSSNRRQLLLAALSSAERWLPLKAKKKKIDQNKDRRNQRQYGQSHYKNSGKPMKIGEQN